MRLPIFAAALLLPAAAMAQATTDVMSYSCDDGRSIDVAYINTGNESIAVMSEGGSLVVMPQAVSASGSRYLQEEHQLEWWTKGNEGRLTLLQEPAIELYRNCTTEDTPAANAAPADAAPADAAPADAAAPAAPESTGG